MVTHSRKAKPRKQLIFQQEIRGNNDVERNYETYYLDFFIALVSTGRRQMSSTSLLINTPRQ